jgi:hypothetical protein
MLDNPRANSHVLSMQTDSRIYIHFSDIAFANRNETEHLPYGEGTLRAEPPDEASSQAIRSVCCFVRPMLLRDPIDTSRLHAIGSVRHRGGLRDRGGRRRHRGRCGRLGALRTTRPRSSAQRSGVVYDARREVEMRLRIVVLTIVGGLVGVAAVAGAALPQGNLVQNPGGEAGPGQTSNSAAGAESFIPPGWEWATVPEKVAGFVAARYGAHPYFPSKTVSTQIGGGKNFLWAGYPLQRSVASQTIDVSSAAAEIDAGGVKACLSGYLGSLKRNPDSSIQLALELLSEDGKKLGQIAVPAVRGATLAETTLLRRAAQRAVPRNTRQVRVVLTGQRPVSGGSIYGFADNISVGLTSGSCEPVLTVKCVNKALVAEITPSSVAKTQRVRFAVKGGARTKQANDARAPYTARFTMDGLKGALKVTAVVQQAGSGPVTLTKTSRRC